MNTPFNYTDLLWGAEVMDVPVTAMVMCESEAFVVTNFGVTLQASSPINPKFDRWNSMSTANQNYINRWGTK